MEARGRKFPWHFTDRATPPSSVELPQNPAEPNQGAHRDAPPEYDYCCTVNSAGAVSRKVISVSAGRLISFLPVA